MAQEFLRGEFFFMTKLYMKQEVNSQRKFFGFFIVAIRKSIAYDHPLIPARKFNFFAAFKSVNGEDRWSQRGSCGSSVLN